MINFKSAPRVLSRFLCQSPKQTKPSIGPGAPSSSNKKNLSVPSALKALTNRAKTSSTQNRPIGPPQLPGASAAEHRESMVKDAIAHMNRPAPTVARPVPAATKLSPQIEARFQALKGGPVPPLSTVFDRHTALAAKGMPHTAPAPATDSDLDPLLLARFAALKAGSPAPAGPAAAEEPAQDLHEQVQALRKRFYPAATGRAASSPAAGGSSKSRQAEGRAPGAKVPTRSASAPAFTGGARKHTGAEAQALGLKVATRLPPAPPSPQASPQQAKVTTRSASGPAFTGGARKYTASEARALGLKVAARTPPAPPSPQQRRTD